MKTSVKISPVIIIAIMLVWAGCATTKVGKTSYAGKWNYVLNTPMGEQNGFLTLIQDGKIYTGSLGSDQGSIDLSDLKVEENKLTATFDFQGYTINMSGEFDGNVFNGIMNAEGYEIPFKATKE